MNLDIPPTSQLTFDEYQKQSKETAVFPEIDSRLSDLTLDVLIASGKIAGIVKKVFRDSNGELTPEVQDKIQIALNETFDRLMEVEMFMRENKKESTAIPGEFPLRGISYPLLGLADEVAEVIEKAKEGYVDEVEKELGDVTWYSAQLATGIVKSWGMIAAKNLAKLFDRMNRGVLKGSGDNR